MKVVPDLYTLSWFFPIKLNKYIHTNNWGKQNPLRIENHEKETQIPQKKIQAYPIKYLLTMNLA